jgi:hypothetical protein
LKRLNPDIQFHFVSGEGVDPTKNKTVLFAKVKGETEVKLSQMGLSKLNIWRPGVIMPLRGPPNVLPSPFLNKLGGALGSFIHFVMPSVTTDGVECSKAFFHATFNDLQQSIFQNVDIKALAKLET